jgi:hypothetical protein
MSKRDSWLKVVLELGKEAHNVRICQTCYCSNRRDHAG